MLSSGGCATLVEVWARAETSLLRSRMTGGGGGAGGADCGQDYCAASRSDCFHLVHSSLDASKLVGSHHHHHHEQQQEHRHHQHH